MTITVRTLPATRTQHAAAEAMFEHLTEHPDDIPADGPGNALVFRLHPDGRECVMVTAYNDRLMSAFPASLDDEHIKRGWAPIWGDSVGCGVLLWNPHSASPEDQEKTIHHLRVVIGRTMRYHRAHVA